MKIPGIPFEVKRQSVNLFIQDEGGRVLLSRRRDPVDSGWWALLGGGVEGDETAEEAARREAWEEAGLKVRVGALMGRYLKPQKFEVVWLYQATIEEGEPGITDELDAHAWVSQAELDHYPKLFAKHRERVLDGFAFDGSVIERIQDAPSEWQPQGAVRYSAEDLGALELRGESQTDWERVQALTDEEIEQSIDHEDEGVF